MCEGFGRGRKEKHIPDFLFIGVYTHLIRSTAVRSQHLYPIKHKKANCEDEVTGSVKLKNTQKSRTHKELKNPGKQNLREFVLN